MSRSFSPVAALFFSISVLIIYLFLDPVFPFAARIIIYDETETLDGKKLETWELDTSRQYTIEPLIALQPTTRYYTFELSETFTNIDGTWRRQTLINGKFPGPVIQAIEGDEVVVVLINHSERPASLHFHGLSMNGTNYMDGFSGLTQCALQPGKSFTYAFTAQNTGTYWYHSHVGVDSIRGMYGPLVIHERKQTHDVDREMIIMISDIYDRDAESLIQEYFEPWIGGSEPIPSQTLIQGKVNPVLSIEGGHQYLVRLINAGSYLSHKFSIDNHKLEVFEVDGYKVMPRELDQIPIAAGQRYSFKFRVDMNSKLPLMPGYWLRAVVDANGMDGEPKGISKAVFSYQLNTELIREHYIKEPDSKDNGANEDFEFFDLKFQPQLQEPIPIAQEIVVLEATMDRDEDGSVVPAFNNSLRSQSHQNVLKQVLEGNETLLPSYSDTTAVEFIIYNKDDSPHPFHLHGHKFWVIERDGVHAATPIKRDTVWVDQDKYVRIRFLTDNAGIWSFHCHNVWHAIGGMEHSFVSHISQLREQKPPQSWYDLCQ